jgi:hypothetical protein
MEHKSVVLIRAENVPSAAQLAHIFLDAWRHFAACKQPLPPLPESIPKYAGCDLLITETESQDGTRVGKVVLTKDGEIRYDSDWVISSART